MTTMCNLTPEEIEHQIELAKEHNVNPDSIRYLELNLQDLREELEKDNQIKINKKDNDNETKKKS